MRQPNILPLLGFVRQCQRDAETKRAVVRFRGRQVMVCPVDRCDHCQQEMVNEAGGSPWIIPSVTLDPSNFEKVGVKTADGLPECVGYVEELGGAVCEDCYATLPAEAV